MCSTLRATPSAIAEGFREPSAARGPVGALRVLTVRILRVLQPLRRCLHRRPTRTLWHAIDPSWFFTQRSNSTLPITIIALQTPKKFPSHALSSPPERHPIPIEATATRRRRCSECSTPAFATGQDGISADAKGIDAARTSCVMPPRALAVHFQDILAQSPVHIAEQCEQEIN